MMADTFADIQCTFDNKEMWRRNKPFLMFVSSSTLKQHTLFVNVLAAGRPTIATDEFDHVYAFLGNPLARGMDGQILVEPDYSKHKKVDDVYIETA
jgi:hypothetical protein